MTDALTAAAADLRIDVPRLMQFEDDGPGVALWQSLLERDGLDITDKVGTFGDSTHNSTLSWQRVRGLGADGVVGPLSRGKVGTDPIERVTLVPVGDLQEEIPFIECVNWSKHLAPRTVVDLIVIHSMEGAEASTKAERVAAWFAGKNPRYEAPRASAHYFHDDDSTVQGVKEDGVAWGAPGANHNGIHMEHAGRARQTRAQWLDPFGTAMLGRSANVSAGCVKRWDIPIEYVDHHALKAGTKDNPARGFTTHWDVTKAFRKSTHVDPGKEYPMDWYLDRVREAA